MALACSSPAGFDDAPRALPIFDDVPIGCMLYQERSEQHEPHIHKNEFVVIDCTARDVVFGELYLLLQTDGPWLWQIRRSRTNPDCANLAPLNGPRVFPDGSVDLSGPIFFGDGPMKLEYLKQSLLGRVIGLLNPRERAEKRRAALELRRAEERP